jgi:hypothetical protein
VTVAAPFGPCESGPVGKVITFVMFIGLGSTLLASPTLGTSDNCRTSSICPGVRREQAHTPDVSLALTYSWRGTEDGLPQSLGRGADARRFGREVSSFFPSPDRCRWPSTHGVSPLRRRKWVGVARLSLASITSLSSANRQLCSPSRHECRGARCPRILGTAVEQQRSGSDGDQDGADGFSQEHGRISSREHQRATKVLFEWPAQFG